MQEVQIALLGYGTVGTAIAEILKTNASEISRRAGKHIVIKKILVSSLEKKRAIYFSTADFTTDINEILNDDNISIVVEVMGGISPAAEYISQLIEKGKHVVTANKALLAEQGQTIIDLAKAKSSMLLFEAAIAGGIPIVKIIKESLIANPIKKITAILNGTG